MLGFIPTAGAQLLTLECRSAEYKVRDTGRFLMYEYSRITKMYYRKTVRHIFTKPVQIEGTTQTFFSQ